MNVHARINARVAEYRRRMAELRWNRSTPALAAKIAEYEGKPVARVGMAAPDYACGGSVNPEHDGKRWIENLERLGWRLAGTAHDIARKAGSRRIDHTGWHTTPDNWSGETIHGVVIRLPARKGRNRYLIGQSDPCNSDCYLVSMDLHEANRQDSGEYENDLLDLACQADRMAEISAEAEREYQEASDRLLKAKEAMSEAADEAREAIASVRTCRQIGFVNPAKYGDALRHMRDSLESYAEKRDAAMEALRDAKRWHQIGWNDV